MTHSYVIRDSFIKTMLPWSATCVTWINHVCDISVFICVIWLIHMCTKTHSYVWYYSFIHVPWWIHKDNFGVHSRTCGMTHPHVYHDECICVPGLIHICDITRWYMFHDSFKIMLLLVATCVTWLMEMCTLTHSYVYHDGFICVTLLVQMCSMTLPWK